jgi:two-component system, sensor histidine kinase
VLTIGESLETTRLRYSLKLRSAQSQRALFLVAVNITAVLLLLWGSPKRIGLITWVSLLGLTTCYMYAAASHIRRNVDAATHGRMIELQRWINAGVVANSCATGSGVWLLNGSAIESMYIVTLYQCCYAMAGFVNASTHVRNFVLGLTINVGSAIAYWAVQGKSGIGITVPLLSLVFLLIAAARFNTRAFGESIRIREENKDLLDSRIRYLAAANHDLRQPLQALSLYINVIGEQLGQGPTAQTVRKAKDTCRTLEELFGNLLELSHYDTGRVVAQPVPIELSAIVRQLDNEFEVRTRSKGLRWSATCPPNAWVHSDPLLMSRLLRNLLDNALRYTEAGYVSLTVERIDAGFDVRVSDSGRGIALKDQERVFSDFTRLDDPTNTTERGMGLGLAIVKRIDQMLGLELTLNSEPNKGTSFRLRLTEAVPLDHAAATVATNPQAVHGQLSLAIWVVEDDENIQDALALQLTQWGCEVRFGKTRQDIERLHGLTGKWPDVFFLDDTIDGQEIAVDLAKWLRSVLPETPILLMTATANTNRLAALSSLGLPLFRKPVGEEQLFAALENVERGKSKRPVEYSI